MTRSVAGGDPWNIPFTCGALEKYPPSPTSVPPRIFAAFSAALDGALLTVFALRIYMVDLRRAAFSSHKEVHYAATRARRRRRPKRPSFRLSCSPRPFSPAPSNGTGLAVFGALI